MKIYPVLPLTEGACLIPDYWHELQEGVICKLYPTAQRAAAWVDYFRILESLMDKSTTQDTPPAEHRIDNANADLTCTAGLCLITIHHALDA
jgi:hypothetical protein